MKQKDDFEKLFKESKPTLYAVAYGVVKNREHAYDVLQDSYIKAWKKFDEFDSDKKFVNWMTTIVTNAGIDFNRSMKRKKPTYSLAMPSDDNEQTEIQFYDKKFNLHKSLEEREAVSEILNVVETLPQDLKQVMLLFSEGNTYSDISKETGLGVNIIRSRINRAKKILRNNSEMKKIMTNYFS